ncbi:GIY-YIG nuclease family protein [Chenggangzhangella methanolivorans]|uniref:GIY-YIG nuclease family protein n=1 Tax=Chenggangzhangella methanolivorans TaxID=1437009 RepID=UPI003613E0DB
MVEALCSRPFKLSSLEGSAIGVYVLICDALGTNSELYVGSASDLRRRLKAHPRLHEFASNVRAYAVTGGGDVSPDEARLVERLLIAQFSALPQLNRQLPSGRCASFERYVGWRAFAGAAAMLIARSEPALRLLSLQALAAGPSMPVEHGVYAALVPTSGGVEKRLDRPVRARSVQFASVMDEELGVVPQPAILKAGSEILLKATQSMPSGALMARFEARFAGLIEELSPDTGRLTSDLVFRSASMMTAFVLGSTRGQLQLWDRPPLRGARSQLALPLDFWRSHDVHVLRRARPIDIRRAFASVSIMKEPDWPRAARGYAPAAIAMAWSVAPRARQLSIKLDLVMSALLACALAGNAAAADVFDHFCRSLRDVGLISSRAARLGSASPGETGDAT